MPPAIEGEIRQGYPNKHTAQSDKPAFGQLKNAGSSPSAKFGEAGVLFQSSNEQISSLPLKPSLGEGPPIIQTRRRLNRDIQRWPETGGYPPIMGGSGQNKDADESDDKAPSSEPDREAYKQTKWGELVDLTLQSADALRKLGIDVQKQADWAEWMITEGHRLSDREIGKKIKEIFGSTEDDLGLGKSPDH